MTYKNAKSKKERKPQRTQRCTEIKKWIPAFAGMTTFKIKRYGVPSYSPSSPSAMLRTASVNSVANFLVLNYGF